MDFTIETTIHCSNDKLYNAWLSSDLHSKMTGGEANCSAIIDAPFSAWNDYISGKNIELVLNEKIIQSWRTTEFSEHDQDSMVEIRFKPLGENETKITLTHTNLPEHGEQYINGWKEHYFVPMKAFFEV